MIDAEFPLTECIPVSVAKLGSRHLFTAFVTFDVFFRGEDKVACVLIEAHIVDYLKAKPLMSMDNMGDEGLCLGLDVKTVSTRSQIKYSASPAPFLPHYSLFSHASEPFQNLSMHDNVSDVT